MGDDQALTASQRAEIWERWQARETIAKLATEFNTTQEVIRAIISLPRPPIG